LKLATAILITVISSPSFAGGNDWPKSIDEAVGEIVAGLSDKYKKRVKQTKREDLILFHHGWGTGIRNEFGLWQGNIELIESACGFPCHPDATNDGEKRGQALQLTG